MSDTTTSSTKRGWNSEEFRRTAITAGEQEGRIEVLTSMLVAIVAVSLAWFCARRLVLLVAAILGPRPKLLFAPADVPPLTICVPARNEEACCDRLLSALSRLQYPAGRLFIVLVSDGSTDGTAERFTVWARNRARTRVIVEPRGIGKARALNLALAGCCTDLVGVCDADLRPRPDSFLRLAAVFRDNTVGAAAAMLWPENADASPVARYAAVEKWTYQLITSEARNRIDANPITFGAAVYRRAALDAVGLFPEVPSGDDVAVNLALTGAGWRTRFVRAAVADDQVAATFADYWHQHIRWFRNNVSTVRRSARIRCGPFVRRAEAWMATISYADRFAFLAGATLAALGALPWWLPATYIALLAIQVSVALAKAGVGMRAVLYLFSAACFLALEVAASLAGMAFQIGRRPRRWVSPRRGTA
jgi:cellulose synthase/poly-beta-1,6-N-acetylglucosamine synthase-like glycosyltransferase